MVIFIGLENNHSIIVGGLFCFNFLNDKVNTEQSTPIGYNHPQTCEGKGLETQIFNLKINFK
jgi:hypothetical protein